MATATFTETDMNKQIGETAGLVWHTLEETGPLSIAKLVKTIDAPRDVVMQSIGWLAREEKVQIEESTRGRIISLTTEL